MTAISFFSYKGGVGRTMALTNLAMRLVEFGKSVFILDFDLEAPGVPLKLTNQINKSEITTGVVDYIYNFTENGKLHKLKDYVKPLRKSNLTDADMWLMPAGNAELNEYWYKLSRINWYNLFYKEGSVGLRFFLDLKEKIRTEFNPDFIFIDSRTGITELSGISLKILADEVVLLFANNEENINGTEKVLSFIRNSTDPIGEQLSKLHLILTRIPHHNNDPNKFNQEYKLLLEVKNKFSLSLGGIQPEIHVIHTDERLQMNERLAFSEYLQVGEKSLDIYSEHTNLFEIVFHDKFTKDEWDRNFNITKARNLYQKALKIQDVNERVLLLTEAINLDRQKWQPYFLRGHSYRAQYKYKEAAEDFLMCYNLSKQPQHLVDYAWCLLDLEQYDEALINVNKALEKIKLVGAVNLKAVILQRLGKSKEALELLTREMMVYKDSELLLNSRADLLRREKRYKEALSDIFKAIAIHPYQVYYGTLAEIYADMGKIEEFYLNLNTALSKGFNIYGMRSAKDAYEKLKTDSRFIELLRSYNMNSNDIFHNGLINPNEDNGADPVIDQNETNI